MRDFERSSCPVRIGDRFYRRNYCVANRTAMPDRIEVTDIRELEDEDGKFFAITGKYMYHSVGTKEKVYSSRIFETDDWAVERKGIDF